MLVGLGTGSTVAFFVEALIARCKEGLKITAVASSKETEAMARAGDIHILDDFDQLDITVDGADEIDGEMRMIKGGGGALMREKILAASSSHVAIIVDESKCVDRLGGVKLPVEVLPFGLSATLKSIPYEGTLRRKGSEMFVTDNGNYIFDIHLAEKLKEPESVHEELIAIPGVLETGIFCGLAHEVVVGTA